MSAPKKARKEGLTLKQAEDEFLGFIERFEIVVLILFFRIAIILFSF